MRYNKEKKDETVKNKMGSRKMNKQQIFIIKIMFLLLIPSLLMICTNYGNSSMGKYGVYFNGTIIDHTDLSTILSVVIGAWMFFLFMFLLILKETEKTTNDQ